MLVPLLALVLPPTSIREFSIGHSLSSEIPDMVSSLAASAGLKHSFQEQFRLGAPLRLQWDEPNRPANQWDDQFRVRYHQALPKGGFDAVVLIDSVPRGGPETEAASIEFLGKFATYIKKTNPSAKISFAEAWHSLKSGTGKADWDTFSPTRNLPWRKRIDADAPMWERIRAAAEKQAGVKITMIPQAKAVARLIDAIEAGKVPGLGKREDVFGDDIHLNPYGMYFLGCVQFSALFGRTPVGLTANLKNRWTAPYWARKFYDGKSYSPPNPAGVKVMQQIAWGVVSGQ